MRRPLTIIRSNSIESKLAMTGIILAGGKSSRMGRNKAFLEFEGQTLIERSLRVLRSVFSEIIISSNSPELYDRYGEKIVEDIYLDQGPLGGLHACLNEAKYDFSFFVACDMPFLNAEVIRFLAGMKGEAAIIVPEVDGGLHPLHAFYHKSCLPVIEKKLEAKSLKLTNIFQECSIRIVQEYEFKNFSQVRQVFKNINTPQEWTELLRPEA
jgi:molybdenum cofactor guanylyltransferase